MNKLQRAALLAYRKLRGPAKYCLIHIGKCGGLTLREALEKSSRFRGLDVVHVAKPVYLKQSKYLIVARDPIARCISAFNWRYKLVVKDQVQKHRFAGEYEILQKYQQLSALAEELYDEDGCLDTQVAGEFETIHHLRERISYYLEDFLTVCPRSAIVDVLMTETLAADIARVAEVPQAMVGRLNDNTTASSTPLSARAKSNLVRYIRSDYDALLKLNQYGFINDSLMAEILQRANIK